MDMQWFFEEFSGRFGKQILPKLTSTAKVTVVKVTDTKMACTVRFDADTLGYCQQLDYTVTITGKPAYWGVTIVCDGEKILRYRALSWENAIQLALDALWDNVYYTWA